MKYFKGENYLCIGRIKLDKHAPWLKETVGLRYNFGQTILYGVLCCPGQTLILICH